MAKEVDDGTRDMHLEVSALGLLDRDGMSEMASCCSALVRL